MPHQTRTKLEAAICAEMERQGLPHGHRNLSYRVRMRSEKVATYRPALTVQRGPILFLVEPITTLAAGAVERSSRFLDQHSPEIVYVLVGPKRVVDRLRPESYDEVFEHSDVAGMVRRIREQDPLGAVKPFRKRRPTESS